MSTFDWPDIRAWLPREMALTSRQNQADTGSPLSGYMQVLTRPGARWGWRMQFSGNTLEERRLIEGYFLRLAGREHRLRLWDLRFPKPQGNCNLTGVTVASTAPAFARSMALQGCGAGRQLLAGDWFATPTQLLRVVGDSTADGAGNMTVLFEHMLRSSVSAGAAITLVRPTSTYALAESDLEFPRVPGLAAPPFAVELIERWEA